MSNENSTLDSSLELHTSSVNHITGDVAWSLDGSAAKVIEPVNSVLYSTTPVIEFGDINLSEYLNEMFQKDGVTILMNFASGAIAYYNPAKSGLSELSSDLPYIWGRIVEDYPAVAGYDHVLKGYKDLTTILQHFKKPFARHRFAIGKAAVFIDSTGEFDKTGKPIEAVFINTYSASKSASGLPDAFLQNVTPDMVALSLVMIKAYRAMTSHAAKCSAVNESDIPALDIEIRKQLAEYLQPNHVRKKMSLLLFSETGSTGKSVLALGIANSLSGYDVHGKLADFCSNDSGQFSNGWQKCKTAVLEEVEIPDNLIARYKGLTTDVAQNCNLKYSGMNQEDILFNMIMTSNVLEHFHIGAFNRRLIAYNYDGTFDNYYPNDISARVLLTESEVDLLVSYSDITKTSIPLLKVPKSALKQNEDGLFVVPIGFIGDMIAKAGAVDIRVRAMVAKTLAQDWQLGRDSTNCITYSDRIETHIGTLLNDSSRANANLTLVLAALDKEVAAVINLTTVAKSLGLSLTGDTRKFFADANYQNVEDDEFQLVIGANSSINYLVGKSLDAEQAQKAIANYLLTSDTPFGVIESNVMNDVDGVESLVEAILLGTTPVDGVIVIEKNELEVLQKDILKTSFKATKNNSLYNGKKVAGYELSYSRRNQSLTLKGA